MRHWRIFIPPPVTLMFQLEDDVPDVPDIRTHLFTNKRHYIDLIYEAVSKYIAVTAENPEYLILESHLYEQLAAHLSDIKEKPHLPHEVNVAGATLKIIISPVEMEKPIVAGKPDFDFLQQLQKRYYK